MAHYPDAGGVTALQCSRRPADCPRRCKGRGGLVFRHAVSRGRGRTVSILLIGLLAAGLALAQQTTPQAAQAPAGTSGERVDSPPSNSPPATAAPGVNTPGSPAAPAGVPNAPVASGAPNGPAASDS